MWDGGGDLKVLENDSRYLEGELVSYCAAPDCGQNLKYFLYLFFPLQMYVCHEGAIKPRTNITADNPVGSGWEIALCVSYYYTFIAVNKPKIFIYDKIAQ